MADAFRPSDADLVDRAQGGDVAAFGQLVERHQDYIYNAVWHLIGCEHDAEDIAQDVFMRAFGNLRRFEGRARFSTWLYGIMLNSVRSYWRRRRGRPAMSLERTDDEDDAGTDPPADDDGPEATSARREQVRLVRAAIAELDEELREIVVLRDIRGLSYEELSEALGVPSGTVKSRLHRARQALREKLEPLYG
jgi:RNA polymerase sigma-70 factor (ECF subfamily)